MKIWRVNIPIAGFMSVEVEADDYNEAIKQGLRKSGELGHEEFYENIKELATYAILVEGNVVHTYHNEATAQCIDDIDG